MNVDNSSIFLFAILGVSIFVCCLAIAGAIWLFLPRWLVTRFPNNTDNARLESEDLYRRTLSQILGFPLAAVGVIAGALGILQALATYSQSQELEYQKQYSSGFEALGSDSMARRIGGLYLLKGLSDDFELARRSERWERNRTLMSALSAFAIDKSSSSDAAPIKCNSSNETTREGVSITTKTNIVKSDVLIAMQILAYRKLKDQNVYNLRNGNFAGSILADDPSHSYAFFENSDFDGSNFTGSGLYKANFIQASLRFTRFDGANLAGAILTKAGVSGATFTAARNTAVPELVHDYCIRTQLTGSHLEFISGENPLFTDAWMVGARLDSAQLVKAKFNRAVLDVAYFDDARLSEPDFSHASLQGTEFKGAVIQDPTFEGARIRNVDFTGTGVSASNLQGAILCNVIDTTGRIQPSNCGSESDWKPAENPVVSAP